jgi:hypothetical protein
MTACYYSIYCDVIHNGDATIQNNLVMSVCPSIHLSVRIEQLGFHWTDFHET